MTGELKPLGEGGMQKEGEMVSLRVGGQGDHVKIILQRELDSQIFGTCCATMTSKFTELG